MINNPIEIALNDYHDLQIVDNQEKKEIVLEKEKERKANLKDFRKFLSEVVKDKKYFQELKVEISSVIPRIQNRYGLTREEWSLVEYKLQNMFLKHKAEGRNIVPKKFLLNDLAQVKGRRFDYSPVLSFDYTKTKIRNK